MRCDPASACQNKLRLSGNGVAKHSCQAGDFPIEAETAGTISLTPWHGGKFPGQGRMLWLHAQKPTGMPFAGQS